jgi:hypothetical protein
MLCAVVSLAGGVFGVVRGSLLGAGWGFGLAVFWLFPYLGWDRLLARGATGKPTQMVQQPAMYGRAIAFFGGMSVLLGAKSFWCRPQHDSGAAVAGIITMTVGLLITAIIVVTYVRDRRGLLRPIQDRDHDTVPFWIDNPTPDYLGTLSEDVPADACGDGTYRIAGPPWSVDGLGRLRSTESLGGTPFVRPRSTVARTASGRLPTGTRTLCQTSTSPDARGDPHATLRMLRH